MEMLCCINHVLLPFAEFECECVCAIADFLQTLIGQPINVRLWDGGGVRGVKSDDSIYGVASKLYSCSCTDDELGGGALMQVMNE